MKVETKWRHSSGPGPKSGPIGQPRAIGRVAVHRDSATVDRSARLEPVDRLDEPAAICLDGLEECRSFS